MKIKEVIRKKQNRLKKSLLGVLAVSATTVSLFPQTVRQLFRKFLQIFFICIIGK